jgi:tRNA-dihydrouridine synthase B
VHMAAAYEPDRRGAAIEFRKHLGWYVKGLPGSADLRRQLHAVNSLDEVEAIFAGYLADRDKFAADAGQPDTDPDAAELEALEV